MTTPEIVMGASLLTLFLNLKVPQGFGTILIAHIMFNISFVVVTVRARLVGFDRHLEEAAMDLGANEFVTFTRVTLPLILPGILAGALLAFALSIDDFVITYFNAGTTSRSRCSSGAPPASRAAADQRDRHRDLPRRDRLDARERPVPEPSRQERLSHPRTR